MCEIRVVIFLFVCAVGLLMQPTWINSVLLTLSLITRCAQGRDLIPDKDSVVNSRLVVVWLST